MGTFSIWHWLVVIVMFGIPLIFVLRAPPEGQNRFGPPPSPMNFLNAIGSFFRNYVNFSGRASRSEFWYSILAISIGSLITMLLDDQGRGLNQNGPLNAIFTLAIILPWLAVYSRRLHDVNRSGWHQLLGFIPPIGSIALLIWLCMGPKGDEGLGYATSSKGPARNDPSFQPSQFSQQQNPQHLPVSKVETLERLARLKENGSLTSEEFEHEKRKLLNS